MSSNKQRLLLPPRNQPIRESKKSWTRPPAPEAAAEKIDKLNEWHARFESMNFYFDGVDQQVQNSAKLKIRKLGANVEKFLSFKVTTIVSANPMIDEQKNKPEVNDLVAIGKSLEMSVWTIQKLDRVMDTLLNNLHSLNNQKENYTVDQNALQKALRKEKMFGLPTNRISTNFKPYKGYYLTVEEPSGTYKPIITKEFPKPVDEEKPWPKMHIHTHSRHTVFAPPTENGDHNDYESSSEQCESHDILVRDSNASGLISGSTASVMKRQIGDNRVLHNISLRIETSSKKRAHEIEQEKHKKRQRRNVFAMQKDKPGYCENCNVKYEDYQDHLDGTKHRKYAMNPRNFTALDLFFERVKRQPNLYYQSSDDRIIESEDGEDDHEGHGGDDVDLDAPSDEDEEEEEEEEEEDEDDDEDEEEDAEYNINQPTAEKHADIEIINNAKVQTKNPNEHLESTPTKQNDSISCLAVSVDFNQIVCEEDKKVPLPLVIEQEIPKVISGEAQEEFHKAFFVEGPQDKFTDEEILGVAQDGENIVEPNFETIDIRKEQTVIKQKTSEENGKFTELIEETNCIPVGDANPNSADIDDDSISADKGEESNPKVDKVVVSIPMGIEHNINTIQIEKDDGIGKEEPDSSDNDESTSKEQIKISEVTNLLEQKQETSKDFEFSYNWDEKSDFFLETIDKVGFCSIKRTDTLCRIASTLKGEELKRKKRITTDNVIDLHELQLFEGLDGILGRMNLFLSREKSIDKGELEGELEKVSTQDVVDLECSTEKEMIVDMLEDGEINEFNRESNVGPKESLDILSIANCDLENQSASKEVSYCEMINERRKSLEKYKKQLTIWIKYESNDTGSMKQWKTDFSAIQNILSGLQEDTFLLPGERTTDYGSTNKDNDCARNYEDTPREAITNLELQNPDKTRIPKIEFYKSVDTCELTSSHCVDPPYKNRYAFNLKDIQNPDESSDCVILGGSKVVPMIKNRNSSESDECSIIAASHETPMVQNCVLFEEYTNPQPEQDAKTIIDSCMDDDQSSLLSPIPKCYLNDSENENIDLECSVAQNPNLPLPEVLLKRNIIEVIQDSEPEFNSSQGETPEKEVKKVKYGFKVAEKNVFKNSPLSKGFTAKTNTPTVDNPLGLGLNSDGKSKYAKPISYSKDSHQILNNPLTRSNIKSLDKRGVPIVFSTKDLSSPSAIKSKYQQDENLGKLSDLAKNGGQRRGFR